MDKEALWEYTNAIVRIQDKRKEQAREEKDRRVAACWEKFKDFDRNSIWGPCGGPRIEWETEGDEPNIITKEHNEVIQQRDMTEYDDSPPSWWTEAWEGEE
jgi:hypothetical protein